MQLPLQTVCLLALWPTIIFATAAMSLRRLFSKSFARPAPRVITTLCDFEAIDLPPTRFSVRANTSEATHLHPVVQTVLRRYREQTRPGARAATDSDKIALAIEGGGMRGCVAAGSSAALSFLGLQDTIDTVYGSSAGAMVGSYFISRQSAGIQIYHDILTTAQKVFVDKTKLLSAVGFTTLRFNKGKSAQTENETQSEMEVLNLDFLLEEVMGGIQPLDWTTFRQNDACQPLYVVASSLSIASAAPFLQATTFSSRRTGFGYESLKALLRCIRVSMSVPGITGGLFGIARGAVDPVPEPVPASCSTPSGLSATDKQLEAVVDAFMCEPIPYRSACRDGATHVICLRTRPDPSPILGKSPGLFERVICRRFFRRYSQEAAIKWVSQLQHHVIYAEDLARLNDASRGDAVPFEGRQVFLLPIAPKEGCREVGQLEIRRNKVLEGMRDGARRTLQIFLPGLLDNDEFLEELVESMVLMILPDDILDRATTLKEYRSTSTSQKGVCIA